MKCGKCGFENKDGAKFCTKCGESLEVQKPVVQTSSSNNSKYIIVALVAVIIILIAAIGFFALNNGTADSSNDNAQSDAASDSVKSNLEEDDSDSDSDSSSQSTTTVKSSTSKSKSWELIGSYTGSGSGTQTIDVPAGNIKVSLSAYPIKNYATNHLYVSGSNGESGGVDWGSKSAVETRSDSFTYESSSSETFLIDYYETVSWEVDFYRYQ